MDFNIRPPVKAEVRGKMSEKYANICGLISSLSWSVIAIGFAVALVILAMRLPL